MYYNNLNKIKMGATEKDYQIVRQNQSGNVRELLRQKDLLQYLSTYEIMVYVELWTDFCVEGPTAEIKKRFKTFDQITSERKISVGEVITL